MKSLKTILGIALSLGGLGTTAAVVGVSAAQSREVVDSVVEAADNTVYSLAGTMNSWSETSTAYNMSDSDGDGIYTVDYTLPKGNTEFKVVKNHSWTGAYGYDNLLIRQAGSAWSAGGNDKNVGLWYSNSETLAVTICFRASDQAIMVFPQGSVPTSWKTFYVLVNNQSGDDWTSDWSNVRANYWGSNWYVVWDHTPSMKNENRSYTGGGKTGALYSLSIPTSTTGFQARKASSDDTTQDLDISSGTINAANFYHSDNDNKDYLYGFNLTIVENGAYLRGDWSDGWNIGGQVAMTTVTANTKYSVAGVDLSADGAVKMVVMNDGVEDWAQFNSVSSTDPERYPVKTVDDHMGGYNAAVVSNGSYNITVTKNGTKWDYQFEGTANADLDSAILFATNFVSTMETNCPYTGTDKKASDVVSAWSGQITAYAALDSSVTVYLLNKSTTITAISDFHSSYDYIYGHYEGVRALSGADFLGREPTIYPSQMVLNVNNTIGDGTYVVVTIISVVLLSCVAGYVILHKKKFER